MRLRLISLPSCVVGLLMLVATLPGIARGQQEAITREDLDRLRQELQQRDAEKDARIRALEQELLELRRAATRPVDVSGAAVVPAQAEAGQRQAPGGTPAGQEPEATRPRRSLGDAFNSEKADIESSPAKRLEEGTEQPVAGKEGPEWPDLPDQFFYHGYLRSGFGVNGRGGDQVAFQAPGALAKYRLGNEIETYGELLLGWWFLPPSETEVSFDTQVRIGFITGNNQTFEPESDEFFIREAFGTARNVFDALPGAAVWAGSRFYQRQDIHINDFYFLDMSGYGGGIEDITIARIDKQNVRFAAAYIGYSPGSTIDPQVTDIGDQAKNNLDLRVYDLPIPAIGGTGLVWTNFAYAEGGEVVEGPNLGDDLPSNEGAAVGFVHTRPLETTEAGVQRQYNKWSIQYGEGTASSLSPGGFIPTSDDADDSQRFRVTEQLLIRPGERWDMMLAGVFELRDPGDGSLGDEKWYSAGIRPQYYFTKHLGVAFEGGWDYVDNDEAGFDGSLFKLTLAPFATLDDWFFARPQVRLFVTYAWWSDELEGMIGGTAYEDRTEGLSAGVQVESWW